jgi:hypothetical protein
MEFFERQKLHIIHFRNTLYRELRLYAYINEQRSVSRYLNQIIQDHGTPEELSIVIGDFSAKRALKGQTSTPHMKHRREMKKFGFDTLLIDEFKTSVTCPVC